MSALRRALLTISLLSSTSRSFASPRSASAFQQSILQPVLYKSFQTTSFKMGVHNVSSKAEFDEAITKNKIVILDAFATWCGPCKVIAPRVVQLSDEFTGAHFIKVDVDEVPDVAQELGIRAMPTFVIFKDGAKVKEVVGANPAALLAAVEEAVKA